MAISNAWHSVPLGEIADVLGGGTPSTSIPEYWDPPQIDWVTAKDISECKLAKIHDTERRISQEGLENSSAKMLPALTTVIIARGATMGKCRMIGHPMALNQTCYGIVAGDGTDPVYLYYHLSNLYDHFRNMAHGSVFDTVIGSGLRSLSLSVPPLHTQRRIADILGALDDKIEVNRRINRTLEAMAQALYKHWFVDFGPYQDGEFVESELGLIPHGWEVTTLSHFVAIDINSIKPANYPDEVFNHYSIPAFDEGLQPAKDCGGDVKSSKYLITSNRILVSKLNPRLYRIWTVYCRDDYRSFSSTEFINYLCKQPDTWAFLNCHLRSKDFVSQFRSHVAGTTGSRQRVAPKDTLSFQCVQPDKDTLCNFDSAVSRYFELIQQNIDENQILAATRNYLLPRLLSGEVPVEAAEDMVEASAPNGVAA